MNWEMAWKELKQFLSITIIILNETEVSDSEAFLLQKKKDFAIGLLEIMKNLEKEYKNE